MAGGPPSLMGPASSMGEHEPSGWPAQMAAVSAQPNPAYLSAGPPTAAQLGKATADATGGSHILKSTKGLCGLYLSIRKRR